MSRFLPAAVCLVGLCLSPGSVYASLCSDAFPPGENIEMAGASRYGLKNRFHSPVRVTLQSVQDDSGVIFTQKRINASRIAGLSDSGEPLPSGDWDNRCIDILRSDGREMAFIVLSWEPGYAHPNLHGQLVASDSHWVFRGFIDTQGQEYHEAAVELTWPRLPNLRSVHSRSMRPSTGLCDAVFAEQRMRFLGRGYPKRRNSAGFIWLSVRQAEEGLRARLLSVLGARLLNVTRFKQGQCHNLSTGEYALIELSATDGSELMLWMWGRDGVAQHQDRLMGLATFSDSRVQHSKVALWHR